MLEISITELEPFVSMIRQKNQQLTDTLMQMKSQMLMVDHYWEGLTSNAFKEKVQLLQEKIDLYQEVIERYASHLEEIIENYRLTELNLHHNVESF